MRASSLFLLVSVIGVCAASAAVGCGSNATSPYDLPPNPGFPTDDSGPIDESFPKTFGPAPDLGTPTSQAVAPPAISGGTLIVLGDGKTAVASDPDRDRVYVVDVSATDPKPIEVVLKSGDEPGRVVEDSHGKVHVALRRGGAIATIDVATGNIDARREVCAAPRGIAFDAATDALHVACVGGELVTMPATGGAPTRTLHLEHDLRDVMVRGDHLVVTKFRSAEILVLDATGAVSQHLTPQIIDKVRTPSVAWRAVGTKTMMAVVHQGGQDAPVGTTPGGYGGSDPCSGIVSSQVTVIDDQGGKAGGFPQTTGLPPGPVLPVDIAVSNGGQVAVVAAGNSHNTGMPTLFLHASMPTTSGPCGDGSWISSSGGDGEPTAVAFAGEDAVVQSRQPAQLTVFTDGIGSPRKIPLSSIDRTDTGHTIFHANSGANVACASCHPEGGDDGRVWDFDVIGRRRTQTFRGGLLGTEPFHWDGDQSDLRMLMTTVFQKRMSGPNLTNEQLATLSTWIDRVPNLPNSKPIDSAAVTRGNALFHSLDVGCSGCHSGAKLTDNKTVDVGTGGMFQVPSLVGIAHRAPYMHTGCARTLTDRFEPSCGGGDNHGNTSKLTAAQIADLVAYLETL